MFMNSTTRSYILFFLRKHHTATNTELSRFLGTSKPNIQHHLKKLLYENQIEIIQGITLSQSKPGRPELVYKLSKPARSQNLPQLCDLLLDRLFSTHGSHQEKDKHIKAIANGLLAGACKKKNFSLCLTKLVACLNQKGYASRWEAHKNGPRIILANCPYSEIIENHPELCEMDQLAIRGYLEVSAMQVQKIDLQSLEKTECIFLINSKEI